MPTLTELKERYARVHRFFETEPFRLSLDTIILDRTNLLIIEADPELRGAVTADFSNQLGTWKGAEDFCVDQVGHTQEASILKQLFEDSYLSHYDVLYIGPTIDDSLAQKIVDEIQAEKKLDVQVIRLSDLEEICASIEADKSKLKQTTYAPDEALTRLKEVTTEIRNGHQEAVLNVLDFSSLLCPVFDPTYRPTASPIARGEKTWPGAASALFYASPRLALEYARKNGGKKFIFAAYRLTSQHTDILPYIAGLITKERVMEGTHIKMFLSSLGVPCISECKMSIDHNNRGVHFEGKYVPNGETISMDGSLGEVYEKEYPVLNSPIIQDAQKAMTGEKYQVSEQTNAYREFLEQIQIIIGGNKGMGLYAFAANAEEARLAKILAMDGGKPVVSGVGMVKTETLFATEEKRDLLARLLLDPSPSSEQAKAAILEYQQNIFHRLLLEMEGMPVQIRLLDSLGELFPKGTLHSQNPYDLRGPDIALEYPALYTTQMEAILISAWELKKSNNVQPSIVIPYIRNEFEFRMVREMLSSVYKELKIKEDELNVPLGVVIETPSGRDSVSKLVNEGAKFFLFGTNDLTSTYLCIARGRPRSTLLRAEHSIYPKDPFEHLVPLIKDRISATVRGVRRLNPKIPLGVSGRHARDFQSIIFFHNIGIDYVVVPPYDVPQTLHYLAKAAFTNPRN